MVGPPRFELGTSCPPDKRATKLRHGPTQKKGKRIWGALDSISNAFFRKLDLFIRGAQTVEFDLLPIELIGIHHYPLAQDAQVAELVDAPDSKSGFFGSGGSIPPLGTILRSKHSLETQAITSKTVRNSNKTPTRFYNTAWQS